MCDERDEALDVSETPCGDIPFKQLAHARIGGFQAGPFVARSGGLSGPEEQTVDARWADVERVRNLYLAETENVMEQ